MCVHISVCANEVCACVFVCNCVCCCTAAVGACGLGLYTYIYFQVSLRIKDKQKLNQGIRSVTAMQKVARHMLINNPTLANSRLSGWCIMALGLCRPVMLKVWTLWGCLC